MTNSRLLELYRIERQKMLNRSSPPYYIKKETFEKDKIVLHLERPRQLRDWKSEAQFGKKLSGKRYEFVFVITEKGNILKRGNYKELFLAENGEVIDYPTL